MKHLTKHLFFGVSLLSAWPAFGAIVGFVNPSYEQGDLVLSFQNPGGVNGATQTLMVNLGNSATVFRDAQSDRLNIINIGTTLATTFGATGTLDWWEATTLYVHVAAVRGTSALGTGLVNGDPERTLYISRPRNGLGSAGFANSNAWEILGNTDMTNGAADINVMGNVLETQYTTGVAVSPTNVSQVDDHNPFIQAGLQGTAYRIFPGGVQQGFAAGPFGTFGAAGEVEAAFDLYRIQARNDRPGQFGEGQPNRIGTYEGTITIDRDGDVSFIVAVPEPTIGGFLAAAFLVFGSGRRRPEGHSTRRAAIATGGPHCLSDGNCDVASSPH